MRLVKQGNREEIVNQLQELEELLYFHSGERITLRENTRLEKLVSFSRYPPCELLSVIDAG